MSGEGGDLAPDGPLALLRLAPTTSFAMSDNEEFELRLGRIGKADQSSRPYLARVVRAARRAGEGAKSGGKRFDGSRIGRGSGLARLLHGSNRAARLRQRRVIVKTRLVRLRGAAQGGMRAHLRYLQRDGVGRYGSPGQLYSARGDEVDGPAFLERCEEDRHQFRIIVSPEDGDLYDDLKPLTRRFMAQMEEDLGTRLDWVAVDHVDTGQPHSHIMLRGRDDQHQNLVIAREYISRGMRERACGLVTTDLGPRQDRDIRLRLRLEMTAERLTSIDRGLVRRAGDDRFIKPTSRDPFRHGLEAGRLKKLEVLGLARPFPSGQWRLADDLEDKLRRLGERIDIIRTMQRAMSAESLQHGSADLMIHDRLPAAPIIGRVVERGLADELSDRHYLLVDGADGRLHHVKLGARASANIIAAGTIVRVSPLAAPASSPHPARGTDIAKVETLSPVPLQRLANWPGLTWLDRQLLGEPLEAVRDAGFGRELRSVLALRRQWLMNEGLASEEAGQLRGAPGALKTLHRRDLAIAGERLGREFATPFVMARPGERISGTIERRVDLPSGSYAVIANSQEFTLVPWRPVLQRRLGTSMSGLVRDQGVSWQLGRERDGPSIG